MEEPSFMISLLPRSRLAKDFEFWMPFARASIPLFPSLFFPRSNCQKSWVTLPSLMSIFAMTAAEAGPNPYSFIFMVLFLMLLWQ